MGNSFSFKELDNEARRRLIDIQQRAEALRSRSAELNRRYAGSLSWKNRNDTDYLYRRRGTVERSLGPRSETTERIYQAFVSGKGAATADVSSLRSVLRKMARVNVAMGLGRVPAKVGRILRRLDEAGVLGEQACIVGTNALFAYEAKAGIRFQADLLATGDVDIALDARRNLTLAGRLMPNGLLGLLRAVDRSFTPIRRGHFSAISADGLMVDLITAQPRDAMRVLPARSRRLGGEATTEDLLAAARWVRAG
ncbi:nucleotidyltransferase domain-containing protein [Leptolyngbya sp. 15MV]|nr:nucleotidyltransferase domain-containing protein [Leptolyngbya sp. 15MV]